MNQAVGIYKRIPSGSFKSGQLSLILKTIKTNGLTGELNISSRDGDGFIALYEGYIAMVFSPGMYATLRENLTRQGLVGETQINELLEVQKVEPNNILESHLVGKGFLSRESFCRIVNDNSKLVLRSMFLWSGLYRFYEDSYSNVPEEILIDIEKVEGSQEGGPTRRREVQAAVGMPHSNLFASVRRIATNENDITSERIKMTIESVAKRIGAFRPNEVVVVVDNNPETGRAVADGLTEFGFETVRFSTAEEALGRIIEYETQRIPAVLVTELEIKGLSDEGEKYGGNDLMAYLRDNYPYVPVIVVTSVADPKTKLKSLFMGASYFLKKPEKVVKQKSHSEHGEDFFIEELAYYIWNLLKGRRYSIQKEEISFAEDEVIDNLLETSPLPEINKEDVFNAKILIADDEPNIRKTIKEYLEDDGFLSVDLAENGQQAIEEYGTKRHDVIVVDIVMPKKDGIAVLKEVKSKSPNSQVVIITGNADKDSAIAAVKFGAYDYIEKPFDYNVLAKTVRKAIEKKLLLDDRIRRTL